MDTTKEKEYRLTKQIKHEMTEKKLSLRALSKKSLIAPSTIYDLLENRGSPRLSTVLDVCEALNLDLKLCGREDKQSEDELYESLQFNQKRIELVKGILELLDRYDEIK